MGFLVGNSSIEAKGTQFSKFSGVSLGLGPIYKPRAINWPAKMPSDAGRARHQIDLPDGDQLSARCAGEDTGRPTVVAIHGLAGDETSPC